MEHHLVNLLTIPLDKFKIYVTSKTPITKKILSEDDTKVKTIKLYLALIHYQHPRYIISDNKQLLKIDDYRVTHNKTKTMLQMLKGVTISINEGIKRLTSIQRKGTK